MWAKGDWCRGCSGELILGYDVDRSGLVYRGKVLVAGYLDPRAGTRCLRAAQQSYADPLKQARQATL